MKQLQKYSIAFLLLILGAVSCSDQQVVENASIAFDKAFIPVFYYTYTGDAAQAERAFIVLNHRWEKLNRQFEEHANNAHNWRRSFSMIDAWLDDTAYALSIKEMDLALVQLDHARYEWIDLRWREGMKYYLDYLWDLEATIDLLVQYNKDSQYSQLSSEDFMLMVYDMDAAWKELQVNTWEAAFFDMDKKEETKRKQVLGNQIESYIKIAESAEKSHINAAAEEMEKAYLNYMMLFGDFEASKTYFAVNK